MSEWNTTEPSDYFAYLVTALNEYGSFREPVTAFKDASGTWRLLGSKGGMSRLRFRPTHFMSIPSPPQPIKGIARDEQ